MTATRRIPWTVLTGPLAAAAIGSLAVTVPGPHRALNGLVWVANRGLAAPFVATSIRAFDAETGDVVTTIPMTANSQAGDLAYAKGKLYVAEEMGSTPAIAVLDTETGVSITRIFFPSGFRPHHVHASAGGTLVAVGLYGTPKVAVVDTRDDTLLGPWDIKDPASTSPEPRVHAGVFSQDANTLYLASDASNEVIAIEPRTGEILWRMNVPGAHELAVTHNGKTAYVTRRTSNRLAVIDLEERTFHDVLVLGAPDTLRLSANEKLLTVGLRTMPAQLAVVDTTSLEAATPVYQIVTLGTAAETGTTGGHQWTSPSGRYTFASYEGGPTPGVAVIDHGQGNTVVQRLGYPGRPHGVTHAQP
jgi:DNA-binding beta-propeller fold protein YncE